ncbi:MAG: hypothetical protein KAY22_06900 [Rhizorhabdus sp.]|uniref:YciI family protein n=1 Tax=Rhizorhabdus sp. TaxID=1968843 RepID=UPI001B7A6204|nr:YciI family protein [Rhizorhabdus sp.]MBP8232016.1 hypothetical protein [Rhizorhabdus sp.]
MYHSIFITDRPGSAPDRAPVVEQHRAYIKARANRILAAGATFAHDGKTVQGGNYIVDMSRAEVDEFVANDPFTLAGIRQSVIIQPWIKACFDRAFLIAVAPPGEPDVNEPLLSD